jgi:hypothetical protein
VISLAPGFYGGCVVAPWIAWQYIVYETVGEGKLQYALLTDLSAGSRPKKATNVKKEMARTPRAT